MSRNAFTLPMPTAILDHPSTRLPTADRRHDLTVLQLGSGWLPQQAGGLERYFADLCARLPDVGVKVRGLVTGTGDSLIDPAAGMENFADVSSSLVRRLKGVRVAVRKNLRDGKFNLVAAHFALYARPVLSQIGDRPFVNHFHGPWCDESAMEGGGRVMTAAKYVVERRVYRRADRVITLSDAFARLVCERYGVDRRKVCVVPGGVDLARFNVPQSRSAAREELGWPTDRPIVLVVRRLARRMGLENLIDAVSLIARHIPDVLVLIAGAGRLADEFAGRIESKGVSKNARLLGFVSEAYLPLAYRAADLTVVPSVALEGFGLVAVESLAAGTPVVVTPVGGLPEVVDDLDARLVTDNTTAESIAHSISVALCKPQHLPDSAACMAYAATRFAWPIIARRVKAVYEEALQDR